MSAGDINQVTIAGHVEQPPSMSRDEDGQDVCEFLLSRASREHSEYGQWELQRADRTLGLLSHRSRVRIPAQPGSTVPMHESVYCQ